MRHRPSGLACLCLSAAVAAGPAATPSAAAPCGRGAAARPGTWYVSTPPPATRTPVRQALTGPYSALRAVAVDPADPRVVFVTDGGQVARSDDAGCSWRTVYTLPGAPASGPDGDTGEIRSIDVARVAGRTRVLLALDGAGNDTPYVARPVLVRSADGVTGWTPVTEAGFAAGVYDAERGRWAPVVRSSGGTAYAALPGPAGAVAYFRSTDGGATWALRSSPADPAAPVRLTGFAVNPWNADELWEWGGRWSRGRERTTGLRRSTDGGATWTWLDPWPSYERKPSWQSADVAWPRRGGPARVLVFGEADDGDVEIDAPVLAWSGDGGKSFNAALPPTRTVLFEAAVTHLANGDAVVVAPDRTAFRIAHRGRPPLRADWRTLPKPPESAAFATAGYDAARASGALPALVAVPGARTVQLMAVPK
ncbi:MAG TPA: hypothetical protein VNA20_16940 [Frankiaceae bacterium]|nr:hypothetical protein [Frankiaceae bacterium]